ncbi:hypothetical protein PTKIN_Ptkin05aG0216500 [Pterospermum kingtungense]
MYHNFLLHCHKRPFLDLHSATVMEISCFHGLLLLVHFFNLCTARLHSLTTDQSALMAFKAHISPETRNILANNWTTAASVCKWIGITCGGQPQRVLALNLSSMDLYGTIPPHIGNFTMLNMLDLSHNNLEGTIPWEIGCLTNIKNLSISNNHLTGHMPSSIGNCTLLKEINFSENNLSGALPPEIGNLSNLKVLRVNSNILRGIIPSSIFNISKIQVISLYENSLSGKLPPLLGLFLPNLVELRLLGNKLQGTIPSSISNASKLTVLDLTDNFFTGSIPNSIGNLRNLQKLDLANNNLTSESSAEESNIISSLTVNQHLRRIVLSGNPLGFILPMSIGNLSTSLEHLLVIDCKLKGRIPAEVGKLSSLIDLRLGKNGLIGDIPNAIGRLQKLQGLHLESNRLEGTIPPDICELSSLVELFLGGNELSGSIPECIGNLTALRNISLGFNRLAGLIPSSLWSHKYIVAINMSSNSLHGSVPLEIGNWRAVTEIDLSKNQLSGDISFFLCLTGLVYLSLAENKIQGSIPELTGYNLEFLDLSCNNLSGEIPMSFVDLKYLKYFNVSSNELEGEIPRGGPFTDLTAQSYARNKALCGAARLHVPPCKIATCKEARRSPFPRGPKVLLPIIGSIFMLLLILVLVKQYHQKCMSAPLPTEGRTILYLEIALATDGFSESNLLGSGGFASVYKGTMKEEKNVAIKVFNMHIERALRSFEDESKLLSITNHPNIVKLINSCSDDDFRALVLEYMPNGTLDKWLYTHNYFLSLLQRLDIMIEVASAMVYLHARHVVHCDLKPSNVLLDESMVAHVGDFSNAKFLDKQNAVVQDFRNAKFLDKQKAVLQTSTMASVGYMAPEYGSDGIISVKIDVYSFGILLMETFTGKKPTDEMFDGEMNLRRWVYESLPHAVDRLTDATLLETDHEALAAKKECILSILYLARFCTAELSSKRMTMEEVEIQLQRTKIYFLRDSEWFGKREMYPRISRQELLLATEGLNEGHIVQFGESSVIYKGKLLSSHKDVAIKVFNRIKRGRESFAVESEVLSFIRHRNVVKILMACNEVDFKALVLEYIPNGSLEKWLHYNDDICSMNVLTRLNIMIDVALALYYLHSVCIIHCNLKPSNVLIDDKMVAHVSDFSISKRLGEKIAATKSTTLAAVGYMAPGNVSYCFRVQYWENIMHYAVCVILDALLLS